VYTWIFVYIYRVDFLDDVFEGAAVAVGMCIQVTIYSLYMCMYGYLGTYIGWTSFDDVRFDFLANVFGGAAVAVGLHR